MSYIILFWVLFFINFSLCLLWLHKRDKRQEPVIRIIPNLIAMDKGNLKKMEFVQANLESKDPNCRITHWIDNNGKEHYIDSRKTSS